MSDKQLKDKAISVSGKNYVQVKDRVNYFNETYKLGKIETKLISHTDGLFIVKAIVTPDPSTPNRYFTGLSQASKSDTGTANKSAPLEVAETSAVGRALGFMGIGVIDGIASADEVVKATREPVENAVDTGLDFGKCSTHDEQMIQRKSSTGKLYTSHILPNGTHCFGKDQR